MALGSRVGGAAADDVEEDAAAPVRSRAYTCGRRGLEERDESGPIFSVPRMYLRLRLRIVYGPKPRILKRSFALENVIGVSATIKKQLHHRDATMKRACHP